MHEPSVQIVHHVIDLLSFIVVTFNISTFEGGKGIKVERLNFKFSPKYSRLSLKFDNNEPSLLLSENHRCFIFLNAGSFLRNRHWDYTLFKRCAFYSIFISGTLKPPFSFLINILLPVFPNDFLGKGKQSSLLIKLTNSLLIALLFTSEKIPTEEG